MADIERALEWDDVIENDGQDFILLPEGDYTFEVSDFERGQHNGSEKLPVCKKAIMHIKIEDASGTVTLKHNLFLHSKTEGMLCAFFISIGQRKKGEKLKMNWASVVGSKGKLKLGIRTYTGKDGQERKSNEIKKFYEYEQDPNVPDGFLPAGNFKPGEF